MIPPAYFIPDVPHVQQPNDYSCSEMSVKMLEDYLSPKTDGHNQGEWLKSFVKECSTKIGVKNTDQDIHFENILPCTTPRLGCRIVHLDSIDDLKRILYKEDVPVIVRYKVQYRHSVVARGYTPEYIIVNDPAADTPATPIPITKLDRWWANARDISPKGRPVMICKP